MAKAVPAVRADLLEYLTASQSVKLRAPPLSAGLARVADQETVCVPGHRVPGQKTVGQEIESTLRTSGSNLSFCWSRTIQQGAHSKTNHVRRQVVSTTVCLDRESVC